MEKIKSVLLAAYEYAVEKVGKDIAIAVPVLIAVALIVHPAAAIVGAIGFVMYKKGVFQKIAAKFRK